jgi:enamine deaminase RidA (YjgF/YER057c/UK114 family)
VAVTRIPTSWTGGTDSGPVRFDASDGRLIFVSGQTSVDLDGSLVQDSPGEEADQMFERVRLSLAKVNATMTDVVKITSCIVDFDDNFPIYGEARGRAVGNLKSAGAAVATTELAPGSALQSRGNGLSVG